MKEKKFDYLSAFKNKIFLFLAMFLISVIYRELYVFLTSGATSNAVSNASVLVLFIVNLSLIYYIARIIIRDCSGEVLNVVVIGFIGGLGIQILTNITAMLSNRIDVIHALTTISTILVGAIITTLFFASAGVIARNRLQKSKIQDIEKEAEAKGMKI